MSKESGNKIAIVSMSICFVAGIILAGSDRALFPWLNLAGLGVFSLIVPLSSYIKD